MFNILISNSQLALISIASCMALLIFRLLLIHKVRWICIYHGVLFMILFTLSVGGGGVQNDGYQRLAQFEELERRKQLSYAKQHLDGYDSMMQIDLQEFNNSGEFKAYLEKYDASVDRDEAIFIGWLLSFCAELAMLIVVSVRFTFSKLQTIAKV